MSSQRKCPKCNYINKQEMPVCTKCGSPLPPVDEAELMRQTMGASYDFKWVVVGAIIILVLQFGSIAMIWALAGKEFLVGEPRRSLLEASIESINDDYGHHEQSNEIRINIKVDRNRENTASKVTEIHFGDKKAEPYIHEKLKRTQEECAEYCKEGKEAAAADAACDKTCGNASRLLRDGQQCEKQCREKCDGECTPEKLLTLSPEDKVFCESCPEKLSEARKQAEECNRCERRVEYLQYQARRCSDCDRTLANLKKDAEKCKPSGEGCFSRTDYDKREELALLRKQKPERQKDEKGPDFRQRVEEWENSIGRIERDIFAAEQRVAYVYNPPAEKPMSVPVRVLFASGYDIVRSPGYFYLKDASSGRPQVDRKATRDNPTRHAGFWIMLAISIVIYFLGGMFTGRLSPGITMKEPATAGVFSGLVYFLFLMVIGADFSVIIFSAAIGIAAFAGAAYIGGWVGEKWQGTI